MLKGIRSRIERLTGRFRQRQSSSSVSTRDSLSGGKRPSTRAYAQNFDDDIYIYGGKELSSEWIISRGRISLQDEITRGRFAVIYKARHGDETVVAKVLKENSSDEDVLTMKAKCNFFAELGSHENILKFIGMVEHDGLGQFMVLEYCENGPMNAYLNKHKDNVNEDMQERMLRFAFEICKGMDFLASKGLCHRRLGARNVLLTFILKAKITGFGPAPQEDEEEEGEKKKERVPVKWTAPECIKDTKHASEKSDIWSYGIVLWEIFSMGESPYPGIRSIEIASKIEKGERMMRPEYADDTFYSIMKKCWEYDPKKRPNFQRILKRIEGMFITTQRDDYY